MHRSGHSSAFRRFAVAIAVVGFTAGALASSLAARPAERTSWNGRAPEAPVTISGKVKPLNRDVELAADPVSRNGLAVWNQSNKKQGFGHIWAAELIRQADGSYEVGKAFQVSTNGGNQRPTVEYLPDLDVYMIMWDTGPRDPDAMGVATSRILSRIYTPTGTAREAARAGTLEPVVSMTDNLAETVAPSLTYMGPSGPFERLAYSWWEMATTAREGDRTRGSRRGKAHTDVSKKKETLRDAPVTAPADTGKERPYVTIVDSMRCPDGRIYWLTACVGLEDAPNFVVEFGLVCATANFTDGSFTPVGEPTVVHAPWVRGGPPPVFGTFRKDGDCDPVEMITNAGESEFDPKKPTAPATPIDNLSIEAITGAHVASSSGGSRLPAGSRAAAEGYVTHTFKKGQFGVQDVKANGSVAKAVTKLWKIKKKRLLNMDTETVGDTILVAWAESKNKKGTKAIIKFGWFKLE